VLGDEYRRAEYVQAREVDRYNGLPAVERLGESREALCLGRIAPLGVAEGIGEVLAVSDPVAGAAAPEDESLACRQVSNPYPVPVELEALSLRSIPANHFWSLSRV
jgi:hypothetical protein